MCMAITQDTSSEQYFFNNSVFSPKKRASSTPHTPMKGEAFKHYLRVRFPTFFQTLSANLNVFLSDHRVFVLTTIANRLVNNESLIPVVGRATGKTIQKN